MKTKLLPVLFAAIFLAIACTKNNTDETVREKITGKNWKVTKGGFDTNGNNIPDGDELKPTDSTTAVSGILNDNGNGTIKFTTADTSGVANLTWSLDASNTYININVPALNLTTVSKILSLNDNSITAIVDTSAGVKLFAFFEKF